MRNASRFSLRNQQGSVFLGSIVLVAVMTLLGIALFDLAAIEAKLSTEDTAWSQLLYCANAGLSRVMIDIDLTPTPGGRMTQITNAIAAGPGATITWPSSGTEPLNLGGFTGFRCNITTTFTDDTVSVPPVRVLRSTATAPNGLSRTAQIQLNFLAQSFQYSGVADTSNLYVSGVGFPANNPSPGSGGPVGPGGADVINGNVFVGCAAGQVSPCGQVYVGSPSVTCTGTTTATCTNQPPCYSGSSPNCITDLASNFAPFGTGTTGPLGATINPRILPAGITGPATPTVATTLPSASWNQASTERSPSWPATGDTLPFQAGATNLPAPDVVSYMNDIRAAVGMVNGASGNLTGTFQGSPVYNLRAIFETLGYNATSGILNTPPNCSCGTATAQNCKIYCQLLPVGLRYNAQGNYATGTNSTPGNDFYITGTGAGSEYCNTAPYCGHTNFGTNTPSPATVAAGAQAVMDLRSTFSVPPIFLANGNLWWSNADGSWYGIRASGRALFVATNDVYVSDNILYKNGIGPKNSKGVPTGCPTGSNDPACIPATADMLGFISGRDIWYGDPIQGFFNEAAAIMLAGRDINYVFQKGDGTLLTPSNPITLDGTMLANGHINLFRDYANSGMTSSTTPPWTPTAGSTAQCGNGSQGPTCLPVAFNPKDTTCGSSIGCWNFLSRNALSGVVTYCTQAPAATCGPNCATSCTFTTPGGPITRNLSSFKECPPGVSSTNCNSNFARRITHYQMTLNYDPRLYDPALVPPGMTLNVNLVTGQVLPGSTFANSWKGWRECPSATCN
jgi:hypothetical protein